MNQTSADGTISYGDEGQGAALALLHAFPLSSAMWRPQVEALRHAYRIITPDLRGFGGSAGFGAEAASIETMADDVARLLDELRVAGPVVLGGLSMGGYVALAFARRHPERLRALRLADTRAEADGAEARANRDKLIAFAADHPVRDVLEGMLPKLLSEETRRQRPDVVESVRAIAEAQAPAGVIAALKALRDRPDATPGLGSVAVPALVLVGSDDALTPLAASEKLAAGLRRARLEVIEGAGHLSNLEQPERFNAALEKFLKEVV